MTAVIQLPTELYRLRAADQLVQEWGRIQKHQTDQNKIVALNNWRHRMEKHLADFNLTSQHAAGD